MDVTDFLGARADPRHSLQPRLHQPVPALELRRDGSGLGARAGAGAPPCSRWSPARISSPTPSCRCQRVCCSTSWPRRTIATMLLFAALGATLFSVGHSATALVVARLLMGLGCAGVFTGAFYYLTHWLPTDRVVAHVGGTPTASPRLPATYAQQLPSPCSSPGSAGARATGSSRPASAGSRLPLPSFCAMPPPADCRHL